MSRPDEPTSPPAPKGASAAKLAPASASRAETVAREDLVMFINACFSCTGQREFYGDARGQSVSIEFLHEYILGNYRRLYARTLAAGINHFNMAQIVQGLLATGREARPEHREEEGALIRAALRVLPPQRAFRVLGALREARVNNRRARAVARDYLAGRPDVHFDAVKYRAKVRAAAVHAHLKLPGEVGPFLFRGWNQRVYETPLFEKFRAGHYAAASIYDLPFSIAEGLARKHEVPRDVFLSKIAGQMTAGEKMRLTEAAARERRPVDLKFDLARAPLTKLALYALSLHPDERAPRRDELHLALQRSAARAFSRAPSPLGKVAAVLDRSYSASGSSEKRRRPLAVALAASYLLRAAAREYRAFWTPSLQGDGDELLVQARGQSALGRPLAEALAWGADLVVIVSDGFENDPPSGAEEVSRVFRARLDPERRTSIVHMNPVFDEEDYAPRALGAAIPTVGLRDAEDLLTMLGFARFADGMAKLDELEGYLASRVRELLGRAPPRAGAKP